MRRRELLLLALSLPACGRAESREPGPESNDEPKPNRAKAPQSPALGPLGSVEDIPGSLRPAFDVGAHAPPPPGLDLEGLGEAPQTFAEFLAENPPRPQPEARTVAILPIGDYPRGFVIEYEAVRLVRSPDPKLLARFIEAWFGLPVRVLPALSDERLETMAMRERDGRRQLDAEALLTWLRTQRPPDATCVLALTLEDLFADDAEHVFGYASIATRVGVHSMLRYDPGFLDTDARGPDFEGQILTRALRVVAHETAHMFGLRHCSFFACVMNPTAGLADLDRLPLRVCPVCLRKLWAVTGVSIVERFEALASLSAELSLADERAWFEARLRALGLPTSSEP